MSRAMLRAGRAIVVLDRDLGDVGGDLEQQPVHIRKRSVVLRDLTDDVAPHDLERRHVDVRRLVENRLGHLAGRPAPHQRV